MSAPTDLNLCYHHKQEWKQSHFAEHNCDHCKVRTENILMRKALEEIYDTCGNRRISKIAGKAIWETTDE